MTENHLSSAGISVSSTGAFTSFIGISASSAGISASSAGISARQSLHADILILVQEAPFTDSRHKEINRLLKKGIFAVIIERDVLQGVHIFNLCFINKIKHPGTNKAFKKLRLVI